ncbi:cytochrome b [Sphingomonas sp. GlSt437]|uniref:cytochrome b n=1 Tax=Sphingomonas sp. GlSt437 TaxID=3389970 RepID=UPI003A864CBC
MEARRYTQAAIWLHWLVALGIIINIALAWTWPNVPDAQVRPLIDVHKSIGITVFGLAVLRLLWRFTHRPPPLPSKYQQWEIRTSHWTHWALYLVIFLMPITGWLHDSAWDAAATHPLMLFGLIEIPRAAYFQHLGPAEMKRYHELFGEIHELGAKLVYALFVLHVAGALKHQFLDKTRELQRMWFWGQPE